MHFKEYEREGMGTGQAKSPNNGEGDSGRLRGPDSAVLATFYGPNFHGFIVPSSLARSASTAHARAPCTSTSRIFKQVISPPSPYLRVNERRTVGSGRRSIPARHALVCLSIISKMGCCFFSHTPYLPVAKHSRSITRYSSFPSSLNHQKRVQKSKICIHLAVL